MRGLCYVKPAVSISVSQKPQDATQPNALSYPMANLQTAKAKLGALTSGERQDDSGTRVWVELRPRIRGGS